MRQAPRSSTVQLRAIVAAALALGLVLAMAAVATAAPLVTIDSGPSGPTNDTTPTFGFTVDASATTVECSIDQGLELYLPCADTFTPLVPLAEGDYTFRVRAGDGVEETIATQDFTVDVTRPSLSIDSGPASLTSSTTPSFGFTVDGTATTVECSLDQGSASYAACTSPYVSAALPDGDWTFRVQASDAAGNTASDTLDFTVDATPPSVTIDSGPSGPTNDTTPTFGFTIADAHPARLECSVDQGSPSYRQCTTGSSHTAASLADGDWTFRVRATDTLGQQTERTQGFSVDATPPAVQVVSGPAGATNDPLPSFGFTVDGTATTIECSIDQGTTRYVPCSGPTYAPPAPLSDGRYTFRVRASDALGNQRAATQNFTVDHTAPSLTIDSGPGSQTNDATPSFGFSTDAPRVECSVDQGAYGPCTSQTTYAVGAPLPEGLHTFRVRATSSIGNQAVQARAFTIDTTPPSLTIDFGPSGTTGDSTPLFGFTAGADATVECSIDQGAPAYGACASATTHAAVAPLADGSYVFRVRATDRAGNQTTAAQAFVVDTVPDAPAPTVPRAAPSEPQLLSPFPLVRISGTLTSAGARIRLLSVRAGFGALVRVTVRPACGGKRRTRRCRALQASGTVGRRSVIAFRALERAYRSGTVIVVRVSRADRIGKYTRFTIVRGKAPRRVDQCLMPGATRGSRCPRD